MDFDTLFDILKFDLYLRTSPEDNEVYRISGLSIDDARDLAFKWSETGYMHDYSLLIHESSAEKFTGVSIIDKSREWLIDLIESKDKTV